jgi:DNA polymerase-3 subunit alpha
VLALWPAVVRSTDEGDTVQGLRVRVRVLRTPTLQAAQAALDGEDFAALGAVGEVDLGDTARFWPADEALARWRAVAHEGLARVVYEAGAT